VRTPDYLEKSDEHDPQKYVEEIVLQKLDQAWQASQDVAKPFVIVADTIVASKDTILGKPKNKNQAREYLELLSMQKHQVLTALAFCFMHQKKIIRHHFVERTYVTFMGPDEYLREKYLNSQDWKDKAGGYGIQGDAAAFISSIEGCFFNVVGFPINAFIQHLKAELSAVSDTIPWWRFFKEDNDEDH
jgi:septum formation protein